MLKKQHWRYTKPQTQWRVVAVQFSLLGGVVGAPAEYDTYYSVALLQSMFFHKNRQYRQLGVLVAYM